MSTSADTNHAWFDPWVDTYLQAIGLTLARIRSPERFLELIAAEPRRADESGGVLALADESTLSQALIGAAPLPGGPGWTLGAESPSCVCYWKAGQLSAAGGVAVALHYSEDSGGRFHWTSNGITIAEFSLTDGADAGIDGSDIDSADLSGVSGTPTFFINGRRHHGSYDITALTTAVLAAKKAAAAMPPATANDPTGRSSDQPPVRYRPTDRH